MTCGACEKHVSDALLSLKGVTVAKVYYRKGKAVVQTKRPISTKDYKRVLEEADYSLGSAPEPWLSESKFVRSDFLKAILVIIVVAFLLNAFGFFEVFAGISLGDAANIAPQTFIFVILIGVVASVSSCMALVGGIVLSVTASYAKAHENSTAKELMLPQVVFNLGRIIGFAILGSLLGALGSLFTFQGIGLAIMAVIVAIVMLFLGIRLSEISPRVATFSPTLPIVITKFFKKEDDILESEVRSTYHHYKPFLLGVATFFLPCGFTQAVQVFALGSGSPLVAGLVMALFAIGTAPGLLGISSLSVFANKKSGKRIFRFLGVLVIAFALSNINSVLVANLPAYANIINTADSISGSLFPGNSSVASLQALTSNVKYENGEQTVTTKVSGGYNPQTTVIYAGVKTHWNIKSGGVGCDAFINASSLGVGSIQATKDTVIDFKVDKPGTYNYSCAMGMYKAKFVAIDIPTDASSPDKSTSPTVPKTK